MPAKQKITLEFDLADMVAAIKCGAPRVGKTRIAAMLKTAKGLELLTEDVMLAFEQVCADDEDETTEERYFG